MNEWSTYRIHDFLLFSKETFWELVDAYNHDLWPWQILWVGLALVMLILLQFPNTTRFRILFSLLAGGWAWVGLVFHLQYFITINWAARYSAVLCLGESLLLFIGGVILGKLEPQGPGPRRTLGLAIFTLSAFIPIELAWGLGISHVMALGWGPERTALGTIGLLLTVRPGPWNRLLMIPAWISGLFALLMFYGLR